MIPVSDAPPIERLVEPGSIISTVVLNWAILAAMIEVDRTLFRRANTFAITSTTLAPRLVERELNEVLELSHQVRLFQSYIESVWIDLGPPLWPAWNIINEVQRFEPISHAVDEKLATLQRACQTQIERFNSLQQRRVARTLDVFAVFGAVASVSGVAAFFFSTDIEGGPDWRILTTIGALAVILLIVLAREVLGNRRGR